jgi:hypothetical protein
MATFRENDDTLALSLQTKARVKRLTLPLRLQGIHTTTNDTLYMNNVATQPLLIPINMKRTHPGLPYLSGCFASLVSYQVVI